MGRKKRFNSVARNTETIKIDDSSTKAITVEIKHHEDKFDECNALVLPSEKRKIKRKDKKVAIQRLLSKKKRKQLEKVVEKKRKKKDRATIIEELSKTNVPEEELEQYVSLTTVQTKGLKRHLQDTEIESVFHSLKPDIPDDTVQYVVNSLKGAKKRRNILLNTIKKKQMNDDPNTLGFYESSDTEDESNKIEDTESVEPKDSEKEDKVEDEDKDKENLQKEKEKENVEPTITQVDLNDQKEESKSSDTDKLPSKSAKLCEKIPAVFVSVDRKPEIQKARMKLPILADEQRVVEAINENPVVIITGETGSGKTTQVPQFLYESGYAQDKMIGITEPRRVAAISMSKRVAEEMNLTDKEVSYLIRFEGNVNPETKIKFMTDGILLKEIQNDFLLKKYSVIILDEAHERNVYTDILIGLLTRIVLLRNKRGESLKLIIMSATLRVTDFLDNPRLFKVQPPVINIDSRQFPVTVHFNRITKKDYLREALIKTIKIHTQLPDGGILVFLTGQREINSLVQKLRKMFPFKKKKKGKVSEEKLKIEESEQTEKNENESDQNSEDEFFSQGSKKKRKKVSEPWTIPKINLDDYSVVPQDDGQDDLIELENTKFDELEEFDEFDEEDEELINLSRVSNSQPLWVVPLYSLLSNQKQAKVFEAPPEGCRLCVVSTNVAETSLTIPNIKYVVDSGKCKTRMYDKVTGVTTFMVTYTSQAAANQRAGRAGRMGPGHCYRLYSSAVFNDQFEKFSEPEILRKPIDDLILQMKIMNIDKVVNFPFPTPPGNEQLKQAEKRLCILGALEQPGVMQKKNTYSSKVTNLGKSIAAFPVLPRYGKMLSLSQQHNLVAYTVCMVAALSVQELLVEAFGAEGNTKKWTQVRYFWAGTGNSFLLGDLMVLIRAVGAAEYASSKGKLTRFCDENGLREKAMIEIRKLRHQLTNEILMNVPTLDLNINPEMPPPTDIEAKLLRQIVLSGMVDQIAHKLSPEEIKEFSSKSEDNKTKWKYAYKTLEMEDPVFMHSSCVLRKETPEWIVYQEIYETNKIYMRGITVIEPSWLPKFAPSLCSLKDCMIDPPPRYDQETGKIFCHTTGTFGPAGWELPIIEIEFPQNLDGIKWFIRFFLEGEIFSKLKKFVPFMLSTPSSVNKSWAKLIPRIDGMTKLLLSKGVMSKDRLIEVWEEDSKFLLKEYQSWLPESAHAEVMLMWPPL